MPKAPSSDVVTIQATFASDIQRNAVMKSLQQTLAAWQRAAEENHKQTEINITYESEAAQTKPGWIRAGGA